MKVNEQCCFAFYMFYYILYTYFKISLIDIPVCISTVEKFVNTLTDDIKKYTKKVEAAFKDFCKHTKSKENRFVSIFVGDNIELMTIGLYF